MTGAYIVEFEQNGKDRAKYGAHLLETLAKDLKARCVGGMGTSILERSHRLFGRKEIVTRGAERTHRYTYSDFHERVGRLAHVLRKLGIRPGERVATLGWNTYTHLEVYFAAPCSGTASSVRSAERAITSTGPVSGPEYAKT